MAKEISGLIKLQIRGGAANPSPPVGPALGAKGVNIMEFCKQFTGILLDICWQPDGDSGVIAENSLVIRWTFVGNGW